MAFIDKAPDLNASGMWGAELLCDDSVLSAESIVGNSDRQSTGYPSGEEVAAAQRTDEGEDRAVCKIAESDVLDADEEPFRMSLYAGSAVDRYKLSNTLTSIPSPELKALEAVIGVEVPPSPQHYISQLQMKPPVKGPRMGPTDRRAGSTRSLGNTLHHRMADPARNNVKGSDLHYTDARRGDISVVSPPTVPKGDLDRQAAAATDRSSHAVIHRNAHVTMTPSTARAVSMYNAALDALLASPAVKDDRRSQGREVGTPELHTSSLSFTTTPATATPFNNITSNRHDDTFQNQGLGGVGTVGASLASMDQSKSSSTFFLSPDGSQQHLDNTATHDQTYTHNTPVHSSAVLRSLRPHYTAGEGAAGGSLLPFATPSTRVILADLSDAEIFSGSDAHKLLKSSLLFGEGAQERLFAEADALLAAKEQPPSRAPTPQDARVNSETQRDMITVEDSKADIAADSVNAEITDADTSMVGQMPAAEDVNGMAPAGTSVITAHVDTNIDKLQADADTDHKIDHTESVEPSQTVLLKHVVKNVQVAGAPQAGEATQEIAVTSERSRNNFSTNCTAQLSPVPESPRLGRVNGLSAPTAELPADLEKTVANSPARVDAQVAQSPQDCDRTLADTQLVQGTGQSDRLSAWLVDSHERTEDSVIEPFLSPVLPHASQEVISPSRLANTAGRATLPTGLRVPSTGRYSRTRSRSPHDSVKPTVNNGVGRDSRPSNHATSALSFSALAAESPSARLFGTLDASTLSDASLTRSQFLAMLKSTKTQESRPPSSAPAPAAPGLFEAYTKAFEAHSQKDSALHEVNGASTAWYKNVGQTPVQDGYTPFFAAKSAPLSALPSAGSVEQLGTTLDHTYSVSRAIDMDRANATAKDHHGHAGLNEKPAVTTLPVVPSSRAAAVLAGNEAQQGADCALESQSKANLQVPAKYRSLYFKLATSSPLEIGEIGLVGSTACQGVINGNIPLRPLALPLRNPGTNAISIHAIVEYNSITFRAGHVQQGIACVIPDHEMEALGIVRVFPGDIHYVGPGGVTSAVISVDVRPLLEHVSICTRMREACVELGDGTPSAVQLESKIVFILRTLQEGAEPQTLVLPIQIDVASTVTQGQEPSAARDAISVSVAEVDDASFSAVPRTNDGDRPVARPKNRAESAPKSSFAGTPTKQLRSASFDVSESPFVSKITGTTLYGARWKVQQGAPVGGRSHLRDMHSHVQRVFSALIRKRPHTKELQSINDISKVWPSDRMVDEAKLSLVNLADVSIPPQAVTSAAVNMSANTSQASTLSRSRSRHTSVRHTSPPSKHVRVNNSRSSASPSVDKQPNTIRSVRGNFQPHFPDLLSNVSPSATLTRGTKMLSINTLKDASATTRTELSASQWSHAGSRIQVTDDSSTILRTPVTLREHELASSKYTIPGTAAPQGFGDQTLQDSLRGTTDANDSVTQSQAGETTSVTENSFALSLPLPNELNDTLFTSSVPGHTGEANLVFIAPTAPGTAVQLSQNAETVALTKSAHNLSDINASALSFMPGLMRSPAMECSFADEGLVSWYVHQTTTTLHFPPLPMLALLDSTAHEMDVDVCLNRTELRVRNCSSNTLHLRLDFPETVAEAWRELVCLRDADVEPAEDKTATVVVDFEASRDATIPIAGWKWNNAMRCISCTAFVVAFTGEQVLNPPCAIRLTIHECIWKLYGLSVNERSSQLQRANPMVLLSAPTQPLGAEPKHRPASISPVEISAIKRVPAVSSGSTRRALAPTRSKVQIHTPILKVQEPQGQRTGARRAAHKENDALPAAEKVRTVVKVSQPKLIAEPALPMPRLPTEATPPVRRPVPAQVDAPATSVDSPGMFTPQRTIIIDPAPVGDITTAKVQLCNTSNRRLQASISLFPLEITHKDLTSFPLYVKRGHRTVELKPRSFCMLPVYFAPKGESGGRSFQALLSVNAQLMDEEGHVEATKLHCECIVMAAVRE